MPVATEKYIEETLRNIFHESGENKVKHPQLIKKLKKLYKEFTEKTFTKAFIKWMTVALSILETCPQADNLLEFTASFASTLFSHDTQDESFEQSILCPFLSELFEFLWTCLTNIHVEIRYRTCQFFHLLLKLMGEHTVIDEELIEKIRHKLSDCLMDRSAKVRTQSIYALHRLQDPQDENCSTIKLYIFHLRKDPSADVRKAVINNIGKTARTLSAVIARLRDVNDSVRKSAYLFISKIMIRSLSIKNRNYILNEGLEDSSQMVRKIITETLLPAWFQHSNNNFITLLQFLDTEIFPETVCKVLPILFDKSEKKQLIEEIPLDPDKKLIPLDKLNCDNVLYLKCLVEYFHKRENIELLESCLPELSMWCDHIKGYQEFISTEESSETKEGPQKFILFQLFEISKFYDLSDEVGRQSLKQVILDLLMDNKCSGNIVESIVRYCEVVIPDVPTRLSCLADVISEIRMPIKQCNIDVVEISDKEQNERQLHIQKLRMELIQLADQLYELIRQKEFGEAQILQKKIDEIEQQIKDKPINIHVEQSDESYEEKKDPETMVKCLQIMCGIVEVSSIKTLTPTLRSLFDHIGIPSLEHPNNEVRAIALKAVGMCLLLDQELAIKHWTIYVVQFIGEDRDMWIISLKCIFDLFLSYGLEYFNVDSDDDNDNDINSTQNESRRNRSGRTLYNTTKEDVTGISIATETGNNNIIKILLTFLDHGDQCIRTLTTHGFCSLLLHGKLNSAYIVSRLIILLHNPMTDEDVELRSYLLFFFKNYGQAADENREVIARTFFPTLRILDKAPEESPLQAIDPVKVAYFILSLTDTVSYKSGARDYSVHNELAFSIIAEILTPKYKIESEILIKTLKYLNISYDVEQDKTDVIQGVKKIFIIQNNRALKACLKRFLNKIEGVTNQDIEEQQQAAEEEEGEKEEEEEEEEEGGGGGGGGEEESEEEDKD